ncbi:MAG: hypothetical protein ACLFOY_15610 [Desulfatibacillaceae bacterium]
MSANDFEHPGQRRILAAVVDEADLSRAEREHLAACEQCRIAIDGLKAQLQSLGSRAEDLTPPPRRPVVVPAAHARSRNTAGRWILRGATAMAAALVLIVVWMTGSETGPVAPGIHTPKPVVVAENPEQFAREVDALVENPLPLVYMDIALVGPEGTDYYETLVEPGESGYDLMDSMIPPVEMHESGEEIFGCPAGERGVWTC